MYVAIPWADSRALPLKIWTPPGWYLCLSGWWYSQYLPTPSSTRADVGTSGRLGTPAASILPPTREAGLAAAAEARSPSPHPVRPRRTAKTRPRRATRPGGLDSGVVRLWGHLPTICGIGTVEVGSRCSRHLELMTGSLSAQDRSKRDAGQCRALPVMRIEGRAPRVWAQ